MDKPFTGAFASLSTPTPENEKLLRATAAADPSELVRACVPRDPWEAGAAFDRLVFARNKGTVHLICGLNKAFDAGLSDDDLAQCLNEVLQKTVVQADLKFTGMYSEGDTAYYEGQVVSDGWALARKAGPKVRSQLAWALPTDRGLARITPAELATMPEDVLVSLAYRRDKTREISEALNLVLSQAEKYDEKTIKRVQSGLEACADYGDEANDSASPALDRGQETLSQVHTLQGQVQALTEQMAALMQLASTKRGWFS